MATTMAACGSKIDYILVKNNSEPTPNATFELQVINKYFKWHRLQTTWVYFNIMWQTLFNIRFRCVYIVEDMCLVPIFKILGNKVAYYTESSKSNSILDTIIGNVCLSKADLILLPSQTGKLHFEKIVIVDPSEVSTGVEALTQLLHRESAKRICTVVTQSESREISDTESAEGCQKVSQVDAAINENTESQEEAVAANVSNVSENLIGDVAEKSENEAVEVTTTEETKEEASREHSFDVEDALFKRFAPKPKAVHFSDIPEFPEQEEQEEEDTLSDQSDVSYTLNL